MNLGSQLDLAFAKVTRRLTCLEQAPNAWKDTIKELVQRITTLENNQDMFAFQIDTKDLRREIGDLNTEAATFATYAQLKELEERFDELENDRGFDPDDLRCDFETEIEDVRDGVSYMDDRIDDLDCYKITEDEARDIATDVVRDEIGDAISEHVNHVNSEVMDAVSEFVRDVVCEEVNSRAIGYTEWTMLVDRVKELEDRLNKPSLGARVLRWLREGPSIKEVATNWYAGIRRGS